MPMAWRCPVCRAIIQHRELDEMPHVGERYRCTACRLDLQFNSQTQRLIVPTRASDDESVSLSARVQALFP
jgi:hypothetical protein